MQNGDKQENKKEYLTKIINSSSNKEEYLKQVQPIDFLKETTGKKVLYKYCSVSDASGEPKKYVVGAIENQTLSCSDPSVFNDPFDCKLGITFRQIYEYKFRTELDFIGSLSDEIKAVIDKKMSTKKMSGTALKAYLKIVKDKDVVKAVKSIKVSGYSNEWSPSASRAIIAIVSAIAESGNLPVDIQIVKTLLPRIEENYNRNGRLLFDSSEPDLNFDSFLEMNGIKDVDEIEGTTKYYKSLFPDNPEPADAVERLLDEFQKGMNKRLSETIRVASLGTTNLNRLMWSHYATNHTGICIEYDFSTFDDICILPVYYSNDRPQVPLSDNETAKVLWALITKDTVWDYEDEWRLIINADDKEKYKIVNVPISHIYLGAQISEKDKMVVINAAAKQGIPVSQMKLDREKFELHSETIK